MSVTIRIPTTPMAGVVGIDFFSISDLCDSAVNDFIPVLSLADGELITSRKTGEKKFLYQYFVPVKDHAIRENTIGKFNLFNHGLSESIPWIYLRHIGIREGAYFGASGNLVYFNNEIDRFSVEPLLVMCVRSSQLFSLARDNNRFNKFCLLVNNEFLNEEHEPVYRNVRHYIRSVETSVDVLYTNDIRGLCLNSPKIEVPKFSTIDKMMQYTKEVNHEISQTL